MAGRGLRPAGGLLAQGGSPARACRAGASQALRDEVRGYDDVMRVEIEHRFGQGVMSRLDQRAREEYLKSRKGTGGK